MPIVLITKIPFFRFIHETQDYQNRITFENWFNQKVLNKGGNKKAYWPVHYTSKVYDAENILVGIDAYPGIMNGCYIQGKGGIEIGDYTQIAPNVVIVSANHNVYDSRQHLEAKVKIGKYCWIGAGAKIMPGVELGDWTIVGAGCVVTKSFSEGYCVIGGVPGKVIKFLDKEKCIPFRNKIDYYGFIRGDKFEDYRKKYLKI
ncbi:acyltransferase [Paraflavitalea speifideaquila]|uniref:acyltransferase n=1 Tax=Paraflavitalea speifideaquila TaxID=3076558 RepID=UPI0028EF3EE8|nr:acyltransferase [Paraflavitalea speifideiaquila]